MAKHYFSSFFFQNNQRVKIIKYEYYIILIKKIVHLNAHESDMHAIIIHLIIKNSKTCAHVILINKSIPSETHHELNY